MDWDYILRLLPGYNPFEDAGDCYFDEAAAQEALDFFPDCLKHSKGPLAGQPFELEDWQKSLVANLFGWKRPDGTRRYRHVFLYVPRKNGKTTLASGIMLRLFLLDGEGGAEVYCAAASIDQANIVFNQAKEMVLAEPELKSRVKIHYAAKSLTFGSCCFKALSKESNTKHGLNAHAVVVDELHAQKDRDLVDVLETSIGARVQPVLMSISTADFDRPSICNERVAYARQVRDGVIKNREYLPAIYEATREDDWHDPKVWYRTNPSLGKCLREEYFESRHKLAKDMPGFENTFKRLHLNIQTEQAYRWLSLEDWDKCKSAPTSVQLKNAECWAGMDLSHTQDLTAFVLFFPEFNYLKPYFWIPGDIAREKERKDKVPYFVWRKDGYINFIHGNCIDYDELRRDINKICREYNVREIAYDRWGALPIVIQLQDQDGMKLVEHGQGTQSMNVPCKLFERMVVSGELQHGGHPVLRWNAANVTIRENPDENLRIDKSKSYQKVDGIVASVMAISIANARQENTESIYQTRGLIVL